MVHKKKSGRNRPRSCVLLFPRFLAIFVPFLGEKRESIPFLCHYSIFFHLSPAPSYSISRPSSIDHLMHRRIEGAMFVAFCFVQDIKKIKWVALHYHCTSNYVRHLEIGRTSAQRGKSLRKRCKLTFPPPDFAQLGIHRIRSPIFPPRPA